MDIAGVDVEIDVIRELPELEDLEVNSSTEDQSFSSSKYGFKNVIIKGVQGEKLDLNPSLEQQNLKGVFTEVNIKPIQTKKLNTTPTTQEQVIKGLFDEVTVNAIEGQELNLNPSEEQQNYEGVFLGVNINPIQVEEITTDLDFSSGDAIELTAQEGVYIKKATINKDINLTPENIKSGVSIAGISGDVADTSDADATSDDIIAGKTAYVANEKIEGTYIPPDTSDATATAEDITTGKTAYVNGEKVVGKSPYNTITGTTITAGGSSSSGLNAIIKKIPDNLVIESTSAAYLFYNCSSIEEFPVNLDTSNVYNMQNMFAGTGIKEIPSSFNTSKVTNPAGIFTNCPNLVTVPVLDLSKTTGTSHSSMFSNCPNLSDDSLNNILLMCARMGSISGNQNYRKLSFIGLSKTQAEKCLTLPNYSRLNWDTGY